MSKTYNDNLQLSYGLVVMLVINSLIYSCLKYVYKIWKFVFKFTALQTHFDENDIIIKLTVCDRILHCTAKPPRKHLLCTQSFSVKGYKSWLLCSL